MHNGILEVGQKENYKENDVLVLNLEELSQIGVFEQVKANGKKITKDIKERLKEVFHDCQSS